MRRELVCKLISDIRSFPSFRFLGSCAVFSLAGACCGCLCRSSNRLCGCGSPAETLSTFLAPCFLLLFVFYVLVFFVLCLLATFRLRCITFFAGLATILLSNFYCCWRRGGCPKCGFEAHRSPFPLVELLVWRTLCRSFSRLSTSRLRLAASGVETCHTELWISSLRLF